MVTNLNMYIFLNLNIAKEKKAKKMERQYFTYVQEEIERDTSKNLAQKRRVDKSETFVGDLSHIKHTKQPKN